MTFLIFDGQKINTCKLLFFADIKTVCLHDTTLLFGTCKALVPLLCYTNLYQDRKLYFLFKSCFLWYMQSVLSVSGYARTSWPKRSTRSRWLQRHSGETVNLKHVLELFRQVHKLFLTFRLFQVRLKSVGPMDFRQTLMRH